jgi:hypothetical protein
LSVVENMHSIIISRLAIAMCMIVCGREDEFGFHTLKKICLKICISTEMIFTVLTVSK